MMDIFVALLLLLVQFEVEHNPKPLHIYGIHAFICCDSVKKLLVTL